MDIISTQSGVYSPFDIRGTLWTASGRLVTRVMSQVPGSLVDSLTNSLVMIPYEHHELHEGSSYSYSTIQSVADNGILDIVIKANTKFPHLSSSISAGGLSRVQLSEGATFINGITGSGINLNRNATWGSNSYIITGMALTATGTILEQSLILGGSGPQSVGDTSSSRNEIILASGVGYLLRTTNIAGTTKNIGINLTWYEKSRGI